MRSSEDCLIDLALSSGATSTDENVINLYHKWASESHRLLDLKIDLIDRNLTGTEIYAEVDRRITEIGDALGRLSERYFNSLAPTNDPSRMRSQCIHLRSEYENM